MSNRIDWNALEGVAKRIHELNKINDAASHLRVALSQVIPQDDRVIIGHIEAALRALQFCSLNDPDEPSKEPPVKRNLPTDPAWTCPPCKTTNLPDAENCRVCGYPEAYD
jgi:hypothetical protein